MPGFPRIYKFAGEARIKEYGLKTVNIEGDGNCLFRALSDQLYGHQNEHLTIRAKVVNYMRDNAADFVAFVEENAGLRRGESRKASQKAITKPMNLSETKSNWEKYLSNMAKPKEWGTDVEIMAFIKAYEMGVFIYSEEKGQDKFRWDEGNPGGPRQILYLVFANSHYWSVRNMCGPNEGPAGTKPNNKEPHHELRSTVCPSPSLSSASSNTESPNSSVTTPPKASNSKKRGREDEPEPAPRRAPVKYAHEDLSWLGMESDSEDESKPAPRPDPVKYDHEDLSWLGEESDSD